MSTEITARNFDLTPDLRQLLESKLSKIEDRLFDDVIETRVVLDVQKYRFICEIMMVGKDHDVKVVQESDKSMQDAVNAAIDQVAERLNNTRAVCRKYYIHPAILDAYADGRLAVQPLDFSTGAPVPSGEPYEAEVKEVAQVAVDQGGSTVHHTQTQTELPLSGPYRGQFRTRLVVGVGANMDFERVIRCGE